MLGTTTLTDTIVAGNTGGASDIGSAVGSVSGNDNLIGTAAARGGTGNRRRRQHRPAPIDPLLAPLGDYGGPTQTMALLPGSPAIGAGTGGTGIRPPTSAARPGQQRRHRRLPEPGLHPHARRRQHPAVGPDRHGLREPAGRDRHRQQRRPVHQPGRRRRHHLHRHAANGASATLSAPRAVIQAVTVNGQSSEQASVTATANTVVGSYTVTALASGVAAPVNLVLNNAPPPASVAVSSGSPQSATVDTARSTRWSSWWTMPTEIPYQGAIVTFAAPTSGASATLSSSTVVTGADGQASVTATADTVAGSYAVTASVSGVTTPASFGLTNLPPITMSPAGAPPATAGVAYSLPISASGGAGGPYTFAITAGAMPVGFTLSPQGLLSGASTLAQTSSFTVTASGAGGFSNSQAYSLAVEPAAAAKLVIDSQPSTATAGAAFTAPVVYEEDRYGNFETADSRTTITAALGTGSGPLQGTTQVAVVNGVATFSNLVDDKAETIALKFTGGGLPAVASGPIAVNPAAASKLVLVTQPSATATAGVAFATQPVIDEEDQFGNVETSDSSSIVTAGLTSGSGPLQGTASGRLPGRGDVHQPGRRPGRDDRARLHQRHLARRRSGSIAISPAAASKLVVATQPTTATAGAAFSPQPVIYEEDQYGNLETGDNTTEVTAALASGAGPLQGTAQRPSRSGVATFTDLADNKAETIALNFTGGGLASATSGAIIVSPAAASKLVIATQPSATAAAGAPSPSSRSSTKRTSSATSRRATARTVVTAALASGSGPLQGTTHGDRRAGRRRRSPTSPTTRPRRSHSSLTSGSLAQATSNTIVVSPAAASSW